MAYEVKMPKFGETMTEGTIFSWIKEEGEEVEEGDVLFEVETDKATLDVEAQVEGILASIIVGEGESTSIGGLVALIAEEGEDISEIKNPAIKNETELDSGDTESIKTEHTDEKAENISTNNTNKTELMYKVKATPAARRMASEEDIKLSEIRTRDKDIITEKIVHNYLQKNIDIKKENESKLLNKEEPLNKIRSLTAKNMSKSYREAPHVTLTTEVNMKKIVNLKKELINDTDTHITFTDIIIMITARAIADKPLINSRFREDTIELIKDINIGIAVDTDKGLVVPVINNVSEISLKEISVRRKDLVERARAGRLKMEELENGTFTVTNLGFYNIDIFTPIINPGEAAILGIGEIKEKPVAIDGKLKIEPMMWLSLSFDHRVIDGGPAAQFLQRIKKLLEKPIYLLLE